MANLRLDRRTLGAKLSHCIGEPYPGTRRNPWLYCPPELNLLPLATGRVRRQIRTLNGNIWKAARHCLKVFDEPASG